MEKIWGIAAMAPKQQRAFEAHCVGDCGKISMGGAIMDEATGGLFVCCEPECPHMAEEMEWGETMSFGKRHSVTLRLLKIEGADEVPNGEVKAAPLRGVEP